MSSKKSESGCIPTKLIGIFIVISILFSYSESKVDEKFINIAVLSSFIWVIYKFYDFTALDISFSRSWFSNGKYVYLIKAKNSGKYKIGVSENPSRRLKELETANPGELKLINKFGPYEDAEQVESTLHKKYSHKSTNREWFNLKKSDIKNIENALD